MRKMKKAATPYLFLLPTILLMVILLVIPICMIFQYSFLNNAIVERNPVFVGLENYSEILTDKDFWNAVKNTIFFVVVSVVVHIVLGMAFALLLNSSYFGRKTKTIARVIYVLPCVAVLYIDDDRVF